MIPAILGLAGEDLSADERAFIRAVEPAGIILFALGGESSTGAFLAARLLADYVLRVCEGLMREAGNAVSVLTLVACGAGAVVPIRITGTREKPEMKVEMGRIWR